MKWVSYHWQPGVLDPSVSFLLLTMPGTLAFVCLCVCLFVNQCRWILPCKKTMILPGSVHYPMCFEKGRYGVGEFSVFLFCIGFVSAFDKSSCRLQAWKQFLELDMTGPIWTRPDIAEHIWIYLDITGQIWTGLDIAGQIWANSLHKRVKNQTKHCLLSFWDVFTFICLLRPHGSHISIWFPNFGQPNAIIFRNMGKIPMPKRIQHSWTPPLFLRWLPNEVCGNHYNLCVGPVTLHYIISQYITLHDIVCGTHYNLQTPHKVSKSLRRWVLVGGK